MSVMTEGCLLFFLGAKATYAHLRHIYTVIHFLNFFLAPPALANLLLAIPTKGKSLKVLQFGIAAVCCWFVCVAALLAGIMIDEAIVGPDSGRPFYMTSKEETNLALSLESSGRIPHHFLAL